MSRLQELWRRILYLARRSRFQSELDDELQFHLESRAAELEQSGTPRAAAIARARREFGPAARAAEDSHAAWRLRWLEDLVSDVRYASRTLRRNPGFAVAAIACLALGIGANTTIFSAISAFLFSVPSARDAHSLISIWEGGNSASSFADYKFLRDAHIFEGTAGINPESEVNWRNGSQSSRLFAGPVSDDYFAVLGVPMLLGRGIAPGETNTAVISHRLWNSRFGGDREILGRTMVLDGRPYSIAGVLPADHRSVVGFGYSPDVYFPVAHDDDVLQFYARLPQGMTFAAAEQRLRSVFEQRDRIDPQEHRKRSDSVRVVGVAGLDALGHEQTGIVVIFFGLVFILAGLVLLIACTNVAGLLLARASSRSRELAVRLSLGASRARIVRHLLAESLLLSALGAAAGLVLNAIAAQLIGAWTPPLPIPIHIVITPDSRLLLYSTCVVLLSALASGLMPAFKAVRKDVNSALKRDQRQTERTWGLRSFLVAGQIAASTLLLATGFLFVHNLLRAIDMNPGFDTTHTVWAYMRLAPDAYKEKTRQAALVREALDRLRALPGVETAAITRRVPFNDGCTVETTVKTDLAAQGVRARFQCNDAGPDYFRAIGIPILRGREFSPSDGTNSPAVAIVNESFARTVFGSLDAVGHTIDYGQPLRIVGVAKDSKYFTLGESQRLAVYQPYFANSEPTSLSFIVRTGASPNALVRPIEETLAGLDSTAAIDVKPMNRALGLALLPSQVGAILLGAMGVLGLTLAAIGLYGILLYSVSRRAREIGLRVALGATRAAVLRTVCRPGLMLAGSGLSIGLALAFFVTRPLAMFLAPGLSPTDPAAFGAVVGVLGAVAILATLMPALRALRVDPMTALREE